RAAEKSPDAAIEMHQVQNATIPRDAGGAAEVLEIDKVHFEAAGIVFLDHDVGLLQIASVKTGLVEAPDLRGHRIGDLFAAAHVASLDSSGAEHEAAQRVGVDERAADKIRGSNSTRLIQIHGRQRLRMREALRLEHRGAGKRSRRARPAKSRINPATP